MGTPVNLLTETTLYVSKDEFYEPDFLFWPRRIPLTEVTAAKALLIVELADTSLGYDLGRKAALYAGFGIAELWVIDAVRLVAHIHREPTPQGYRSVVALPKDARLVPQAEPALAVTLAELDLR